ncbi:hypothetical protein IC582_014858 [Cucumis melo]
MVKKKNSIVQAFQLIIHLYTWCLQSKLLLLLFHDDHLDPHSAETQRIGPWLANPSIGYQKHERMFERRRGYCLLGDDHSCLTRCQRSARDVVGAEGKHHRTWRSEDDDDHQPHACRGERFDLENQCLA